MEQWWSDNWQEKLKETSFVGHELSVILVRK
jgi:hypothetical protein